MGGVEDATAPRAMDVNIKFIIVNLDCFQIKINKKLLPCYHIAKKIIWFINYLPLKWIWLKCYVMKK